jgi:hypothetical protein
VAALNMKQYLDATDKFMRLALKAQSQCRTTVEALGELKNPQPVAFVKQANIGRPYKCITASFTTNPRAHARKAENEQDKLL